MSTGKKIILGIDPGLADTGYGIILSHCGKINHIAHGSIKTNKNEPLAKRLSLIEQSLVKIIDTYQPEASAVEQLFFCRNITTALSVGQARGVILSTLYKKNISIKELTPLQVKQGVTGYGQASKKQIQQMVKLILNLKTIPKPDDAADALAIAICASNNQYI